MVFHPVRMPRCGGKCAGWAFVCALLLLAGVAAAEEEPAEPAEPAEKPSPTKFSKTAAAIAPEGVLNAQALEKGQWMLAYRYSREWLKGNRSDTRNVSDQRALRAQSPPFETVPYKRSIQTHLFSLGWAPFSRLTLIARLPVILLDQGSTAADGSRFHSKTEGIGDLHLMALIPFMRKKQESLMVNIGFRAPTGSIRDRRTISGAPDPRMGYSMQPGRGSWGFIPGLTYRGHWKALSWGLQYRSVFWLNTNSLHYRPGARYSATTWAAVSWADWLSTSFRIGWEKWGNVHGGDKEFGDYPYSQPDEDSKRQGGQRVDLAPGVNFRIPCCGEILLGFEAVFPVWQQLDGPQLKSRWMLHTGLRAAF